VKYQGHFYVERTRVETYLEVFNEHDFIWVGFSSFHNDYLVEGFRKVDGGVKHLIGRYRHARLEAIYHDLGKAYLSKRPFQVGQGCDGSGGACCHALFYHFCQSRGLDASELYHQAYFERDGEKYQKQNYEVVLKLADWQGVAYPTEWDAQAYQGLIKSLLDINNRSLVAVLEETIERLSPDLEQQAQQQLRELSLLN
jgi:hypothetical protein